MGESFTWSEGNIYLWTGSATASAVPAYAEDTQVTLGYGWDNWATVSGVWNDTLTGERADLTFGTLYTTDNSALMAFHAAKTAVHVHLRHDALNTSAGVYLYSGRIDEVMLAGRTNDIYRFRVTYHANVWSAY